MNLAKSNSPPAKGESAEGGRGLVPRLRFPGFVPAWDARQVGEVAHIIKGKGIAKSDISDGGTYPCIRYGELYTIYGEVITDVASRTSLPAEALFFGEPGDVIVPSSGETKEDIATAACVVPAGVALGGDINVVRSTENGVFLSYYLNGALRKVVARVAQGDSVVHLYPHQIAKLPIALPPRDEQQKIADCLSSLDACIRVEARQLDAFKAHKDGLMQQLFPSNHPAPAGHPSFSRRGVADLAAPNSPPDKGEYGEAGRGLLPRLRFPGFVGEWGSAKLGDKSTIVRGGSPRPIAS